jgi:hypothetical protein
MSRDTISDRPAMHDLVLHPTSSPTRGRDRRPRSGAEGLQCRSPGLRDEETFCLVSAVDTEVVTNAREPSSIVLHGTSVYWSMGAFAVGCGPQVVPKGVGGTSVSLGLSDGLCRYDLTLGGNVLYAVGQVVFEVDLPPNGTVRARGSDRARTSFWTDRASYLRLRPRLASSRRRPDTDGLAGEPSCPPSS